MTATWGAVFDWDGVIINSAAHHEESWERLAREEGHILPEGHFKRGFGMKNTYIIPELLAWTRDPSEVERLSNRKEALYREVIRERGIVPLPGVVDFLKFLKASGVPRSIGSSTHRLNITTSLESLHLEGYFDAITSAEDVSRGKPDPQVFLIASEKIDRTPDRCVVFEDAHVGIDAARAAGMRVVAVTTTHPAAELAKADFVVDRLDRIPVTLWEKWFE